MSESIYFEPGTGAFGDANDLTIVRETDYTPSQWERFRHLLYHATGDREVAEVFERMAETLTRNKVNLCGSDDPEIREKASPCILPRSHRVGRTNHRDIKGGEWGW